MSYLDFNYNWLVNANLIATHLDLDQLMNLFIEMITVFGLGFGWSDLR
jgi:hypothetical protein